jgi:hypothetical protein
VTLERIDPLPHANSAAALDDDLAAKSDDPPLATAEMAEAASTEKRPRVRFERTRAKHPVGNGPQAAERRHPQGAKESFPLQHSEPAPSKPKIQIIDEPNVLKPKVRIVDELDRPKPKVQIIEGNPPQVQMLD